VGGVGSGDGDGEGAGDAGTGDGPAGVSLEPLQAMTATHVMSGARRQAKRRSISTPACTPPATAQVDRRGGDV